MQPSHSRLAVQPARRPPWWTGMALDNSPVIVAIVEAALVVVANYDAFLLRFEGAIPASQRAYFSETIALLVLVRMLTFVLFRLFAGLWQYTGASDLFR